MRYLLGFVIVFLVGCAGSGGGSASNTPVTQSIPAEGMLCADYSVCYAQCNSDYPHFADNELYKLCPGYFGTPACDDLVNLNATYQIQFEQCIDTMIYPGWAP